MSVGLLKMRKTLLITFIPLLLVTSCESTTNFIVKVSAISSPSSLNKKTYILLAGNTNINSNSLEFQEYAQYLKRGLYRIGLVQVKNQTNADIAIFLFYGISDPETKEYTYSRPVWGKTGTKSKTTTGNVNLFGNSATYSETTETTPEYGIVGYKKEVNTYTTYFRYMVLDAYDLKEYYNSGKEIQLWKTTVTSEGSSGDLRRVFPVLVAASYQHFSKDTKQEIKIELSEETDERLKIIKNISE